MRDHEAIAIANEFIQSRLGCPRKLLGTRDLGDTWSVIYQTAPMGSETIIDGPTVVIVDQQSGEAMFFNDYFVKKYYETM